MLLGPLRPILAGGQMRVRPFLTGSQGIPRTTMGRRGFAASFDITGPSFLTGRVFAATPLAPEVVRRLHDAVGIRFLSASQEKTLSPIITGQDVVCHAPTGSGKTLGYLVPCLHLLLSGYPPEARRPKPEAVVVFVPTPLLAQQVYRVACQLAPPSVSVTLAGKTRRPFADSLSPSAGTLLVAVPLATVAFAPVRRHIERPHVVVLDEVDQLMADQRAKLDALLTDGVQGVPRQVLAFGATLCDPEAFRHMEEYWGLRSDRLLVDLFSTDGADTIPDAILQRIVVAAPHQLIALLLTLLEQKLKGGGGKVMVFVPTVELTVYLAKLFRLLLPSTKVQDLHGLIEDKARERIRSEFQLYSNQVLFTSEVATRGMDFVGVTCVLQLGRPPSRLQYIHRVGRTGRRGLPGAAILLLHPLERPFIAQLTGLVYRLSELEGSADQPLWAAARRVEEAARDLAMQPEWMTGMKREDGYLKNRRHIDAMGAWAAWVRHEGEGSENLGCTIDDLATVAEGFGKALGVPNANLKARALSLLRSAAAKAKEESPDAECDHDQ